MTTTTDREVDYLAVRLAAAVMREAVEVVAATGTQRNAVQVIFTGIDGEWGWSVETTVLTFSTPTGHRKSGTGKMKAAGWSKVSPVDAALGCVQDIERMVRGGREITGGGRIEVAKGNDQ
jgi:hypothetical protein